MDSLVLPLPALIERLERRFRPPSYFLGANSAGFRTIRELTLFARRPSSATTMDVHHRHLQVSPLTGEVVVVAGDRGHAVRAGEALLVLPFVAHHYRLVSAERPMLLFIGFEAAMGELEAGAPGPPSTEPTLS